MIRAALCAVPVALLLSTTAGCTGSEAPPLAIRTIPVAPVLTSADCRDLLPRSAVRALGWTGATAPTLDARTCTVSTADGTIAVRRSPVVAPSDAALPAAAEAAFDQRCAVLDQGGAGREVDWLGAGTSACVVVPRGGAVVSRLLAVPRPGLLVEVTVRAVMGTATAALREALVDVQQAAAQHL